MIDNTKHITLSVIVPCYNVEHYLDRSLGCLERQWNGRNDYEIILVNDASTDGTIKKLRDFKGRYPDNVVVIDKPVNAGVAEARNSGLEVFRGKWVIFFDPDDALVDNGYNHLLEIVQDKDCDILSFDAKIVHEGEWNNALSEEPMKSGIDWIGSAQDYLLHNHFGTCFRFLFKRELIKDIRFKPLTFLEDVVFVLPILLSDIRVGITKSNVYFYILHSSSATNMIDSKRLTSGCDDILTAIQFMEKCKEGQSEAIKERIGKRQQVYRNNLITRLFLSDKSLKEILEHQSVLQKLNIPITANRHKKEIFYDYVFDHPWLMVPFRPLYRIFRRVRKSSIK